MAHRTITNRFRERKISFSGNITFVIFPLLGEATRRVLRLLGRRAAPVRCPFVSLSRFHPFSRLGLFRARFWLDSFRAPFNVRLLRVGPSFAPASRWVPSAPRSRFQPFSRFHRQAASGWTTFRARFWLGPVRAPFQVSATRRSNEKGFEINRASGRFRLGPFRVPC